ncbi:PhaM family polyhydroxyalkanoate granule multifunctional regulatory protein [Achromobacter xylosoxidans]|uniref:PhaM family polyhydroxyalkanoate granule multifunctional regulatory protein n=1 Tax=Alcaligenes xylosoxydans xylosoxydans TaxID=85698 RepID=UPI0006BF5369|nr:PhaM family polyhydroxyalkanoate granule multifunctional regulatory protein [Achromobacter xylosoxidans]KAA5919819.1 transcriptional regulator [Achromobacter xylosoxidans]MBK1977469.1 transcriptional regulator [Achromobacter xylosoxidans]MCZ8388019.1 transcriptional regulator [Achromobacter xylosoxidans]MCZ8438491.1 transcriptional regulator [Achromobacter xylosoxidans]MEC6408488.1 PhaM family polyhydroxyalkanoate granule multifunctional regulatory protein [Achromobacter xylosoxidans]
MSDQHSNPFVLPGMGQNSDLSGNPLLASMEMMRQAWAGLTGPGGLASSLPMAPPMNLEDLDRRIAELRSVENWLRMNLSMLSSTIQGMEVQRSTISTLRAFVDSAANLDLGAVRESGAASPLEVVLGLKPAPAAKRAPQGASQEAEGAAKAEAKAPESDAGTAGAQPGMSEQMGAAAQSASKAWWDLLQQQFNQIAAATAASMPGSQPAPEADKSKAKPGGPQAAAAPAAKAAKTVAKPARKTARKPAAKAATKNSGPADGKP